MPWVWPPAGLQRAAVHGCGTAPACPPPRRIYATAADGPTSQRRPHNENISPERVEDPPPSKDRPHNSCLGLGRAHIELHEPEANHDGVLYRPYQPRNRVVLPLGQRSGLRTKGLRAQREQWRQTLVCVRRGESRRLRRLSNGRAEHVPSATIAAGALARAHSPYTLTGAMVVKQRLQHILRRVKSERRAAELRKIMGAVAVVPVTAP